MRQAPRQAPTSIASKCLAAPFFFGSTTQRSRVIHRCTFSRRHLLISCPLTLSHCTVHVHSIKAAASHAYATSSISERMQLSDNVGALLDATDACTGSLRRTVAG